MTLVSGEKDAFGHVRLGGIGDRLAKRDRGRAPARRPARSCSATSSAAARPTAFDRWLATRFGLQAIDAVAEGDFGRWWRCAAPTSSGSRSSRAPASSRLVAPEEYAEAEVFFG